MRREDEEVTRCSTRFPIAADAMAVIDIQRKTDEYVVRYDIALSKRGCTFSVVDRMTADLVHSEGNREILRGVADVFEDVAKNLRRLLDEDEIDADQNLWPAHNMQKKYDFCILENLKLFPAILELPKRFKITAIPLAIERGTASPVRAVAIVK